MVGDSRVVVTGFIRGVVMMPDRSNVRGNRWSLDARKTGHTTELLPRGWFGSFKLSMDVVRGWGCEWKRRVIGVGTRQRCADVLFPKLAKVTELCLPWGHSSGRNSPRSGGELIRYIDLTKIHENVLANDILPVVVGEERSTVRGDASNDIGVIKAHKPKGGREPLLIVGFACVPMGRWIIGYTLGDSRGVVEGMIGGVTEFRCGNGSGIAIIDGVVVVVPEIVKVGGVGKVLRNGEGITVLRVGPVVVGMISKATVIETILSWIGSAPGGGREGEAGMIVRGVRMIGGRNGIGIRVVTGRLGVGGKGGLVVLIINNAGTIEELSLGPITSGIV